MEGPSDGSRLIDVTPMLDRWATTVELAEIELASTPRWRWLRRAKLRVRIETYMQGIGAVYSARERR